MALSLAAALYSYRKGRQASDGADPWRSHGRSPGRRWWTRAVWIDNAAGRAQRTVSGTHGPRRSAGI